MRCLGRNVVEGKGFLLCFVIWSAGAVLRVFRESELCVPGGLCQQDGLNVWSEERKGFRK